MLEEPDFVADCLPDVPPQTVRDATLAHILSVVHSVTADGVAHSETPRHEAFALLRELERARDRVIARVLPSGPEYFQAADRAASAARKEARAFFSDGTPVNLGDYLTVVRKTMAPRIQAGIVLAMAWGMQGEHLVLLEQALECAWVAREIQSDADGWRQAWRRGNAWVVHLARTARARECGGEHPTEPDLIGAMVRQSGVLAAMYGCGSRLWQAAAQRAKSIRADRLAFWAKQEARTCQTRGVLDDSEPFRATGAMGA